MSDMQLDFSERFDTRKLHSEDEIHYHVQRIIPLDEGEANKMMSPNAHPIMFVCQNTRYTGVFAYERAYANMDPGTTLIACFTRNCTNGLHESQVPPRRK